MSNATKGGLTARGQRMAEKVIADFNETAEQKVKLTKILFPQQDPGASEKEAQRERAKRELPPAGSTT
jgi:hypothetical protein